MTSAGSQHKTFPSRLKLLTRLWRPKHSCRVVVERGSLRHLCIGSVFVATSHFENSHFIQFGYLNYFVCLYCRQATD